MRLLCFLAVGAFLGIALSLTLPPARAASSSAAILDQRLPELKFQGIALKDCLDFLRDVSGANIHVNWRVLEASGISQDTQINMHLRDIRLGKALELMLNQAGGNTSLSFSMDQNVIEITTAEMADKVVVTRIYPIEDLIVEVPDFTNPPDLSLQAIATGGSSGRGGAGNAGGALGGSRNSSANDEKPMTRTERAEQLVEMIRQLIRPEIWKENGGPASIRYYNGKLVITAPRSVQEAIGGPLDD